MFVVLEGCDCSGKTTQCNLLSDELHKKCMPNMILRFPDRTTSTGQLLDKYLKGENNLDPHVAHLLFSANRWECQSKIQTLINNGVVIIADRYKDSGAAYSMTTGCEKNWCTSTDVGLIEPDLIIFIDVHPSIVSNRHGFGNERYENINFQTQVWENLHALSTPQWKIIDGTQTIEQIAQEIFELVYEKLNKNLS